MAAVEVQKFAPSPKSDSAISGNALVSILGPLHAFRRSVSISRPVGMRQPGPARCAACRASPWLRPVGRPVHRCPRLSHSLPMAHRFQTRPAFRSIARPSCSDRFLSKPRTQAAILEEDVSKAKRNARRDTGGERHFIFAISMEVRLFDPGRSRLTEPACQIYRRWLYLEPVAKESFFAGTRKRPALASCMIM